MTAAAKIADASSLGLAYEFASYVDALCFEDLDQATVERTKTHLIDSIGCAIGAFDERPVRICREIASEVTGRATIIGTQTQTSTELATFANCAAIRYLDFNDTYIGRFSVHPSDLIGACISGAEAENRSIEDFITAIVAAYEINCRLVDACDISTRGWDPTVMTPPAVALAAGKLMGLSVIQLAHAVSIALSDHIPMAQTRVQMLSDWKGLSDGEACRNAVFAARLARSGLTGPAPIFEGRSGFFQQVTGAATIDVRGFGGHGNEFRINRCSLKRYPAVIYTQTAAVAGIEVAKQVGSLDRIAKLEIATTRRGHQRTGSEAEKWSPETRDTADHSLPYITARAMFDGDITNETFERHMFRDPVILEFMKKITVAEDPALTARQGEAAPTRVTVILNDGERISHEVDYAPGFPRNPMSTADLEQKFRGNVGSRWTSEQTARVLRALGNLQQQESISTLR